MVINQKNSIVKNGALDFRECIKAAQTGTVMEAEIVSLDNKGKLRVTYNWLYSALNCDPNDSSIFKWVFTKIDDTHVAISPKDGYAGKTLYASVRDDWSWYLQVQAPHSADWITAIQRDEILIMEPHQLHMVSFKGFNNEYVAIDQDISSHQYHAGYRLRSIGTVDVKSRMWFLLGVTESLQEGLKIRMKHETSEADVRNALIAIGKTPTDEDIKQIHKLFV